MDVQKSFTNNYNKHTSKNPIQKFLINNFLKIILKESKKLQPREIFDAGCGEGFILKKLKENKIGSKLLGIDFSKNAIEIGKKLHPTLSLQHASIYDIPFKSDTFDLVICSEVLEHLENPEKALKELERVTKKYCIISVPHEPWFMLANLLRGKNISRWGNDIEHIQHWTSRGINSLVQKNFSVEIIKTPFPWTILVAKKR